jgi:hypothetical protein
MNTGYEKPEIEKSKRARRRRPPVEGLPATRPTCAFCHKALAYWTDETRERTPDGPHYNQVVRRVFTRWKGYPFTRAGVPIFHSLQCALEFACEAHGRGFRTGKA